MCARNFLPKLETVYTNIVSKIIMCVQFCVHIVCKIEKTMNNFK